LSHEIGSIVNSLGMLTSCKVLTDLSKYVKTSCGYVNMAKKADNPHWKNFFSV